MIRIMQIRVAAARGSNLLVMAEHIISSLCVGTWKILLKSEVGMLSYRFLMKEAVEDKTVMII